MKTTFKVCNIVIQDAWGIMAKFALNNKVRIFSCLGLKVSAKL